MNNEKWHDQAEAKWDEMSGRWQARSEQMWKEGSRKKVLPFFRSFVEKESKVLDLGCGDGQGSVLLEEAGYDVTGVDLSEKMIDIASQRKSTATFLQGDVTELPFQEGEFDGVMAINCLEWVASPLEALEEIKRVVRTDGTFVAGVLGPVAGPRTNSYPRLEGEEVVMNTMMPWEFQQLAEAHGWETLGTSAVPKEGAPEDLRQPLLQQAVSFMTLFALKKKRAGVPVRESQQ